MAIRRAGSTYLKYRNDMHAHFDTGPGPNLSQPLHALFPAGQIANTYLKSSNMIVKRGVYGGQRVHHKLSHFVCQGCLI